MLEEEKNGVVRQSAVASHIERSGLDIKETKQRIGGVRELKDRGPHNVAMRVGNTVWGGFRSRAANEDAFVGGCAFMPERLPAFIRARLS
jgi:hypothetical protein